MRSFKQILVRVPSGAACRLLLCAAALSAVGCQVEMGGQTLPSPYYMQDDIQYYRPGPEFKLANEAAYMAQFKEQAKAQQRGAPNAP